MNVIRGGIIHAVQPRSYSAVPADPTDTKSTEEHVSLGDVSKIGQGWRARNLAVQLLPNLYDHVLNSGFPDLALCMVDSVANLQDVPTSFAEVGTQAE